MKAIRINLLLIFMAFGSAPLLGQTSVFTNGTWVKLQIPNQGVYRLDYNDMASMGFDMGTLNTAKIQLRGHQCGMLPEVNGTHTAGMPQIPIAVEDGNDGKFDQGDYILFYAGSANKWTFNAGTRVFEHQRNLYSNVGYLYIGVGEASGLRLSTNADEVAAPSKWLDKYKWVFFHDSDISNPVGMGRTWLGEKLGNEGLRKDFQFGVPSDASDSVFVKVSFAGAMKNEAGSVDLTVQGIRFNQGFGALNKDYESFRLAARNTWFSAPNKKVDISLEVTRPNTESAAWLDFVEINANRPIQTSNNPLIIRSDGYFSSGLIETRLATTGLRVWDISNEMAPAAMVTHNSGSFDYFRAYGSVAKGKTFVAFKPEQAFKPIVVGKLAQMDVLAGDAAEMIIISHPNFKSASEDLAAFRRSNDGLDVKVVYPQDIYNEYSAGQQDIVAIRDYLRDEYNKSLKAGKVLKFTLLMGTTSYDHLNRVEGNTNFLPIYHYNSYYKSQTFCLDDFYGYIDTVGGDPADFQYKMWIAIGRIPCRTNAEAQGVVNKLKRYASVGSLGPWRTELTFICDDVDTDWEREFVEESEKYAVKIDAQHSDIQVNKIYTDAYKQVSTGNTEKYPEVSEAINRTMNNGGLFVNYQGHGGESGWAQEKILNVPMVNSWTNPYKMPVLFTATCEFSRFDNPAEQSAGELAILNPSGGAIALLSTTRLVFVNGNSQINYDFWTNYGFPKPNDPVPTIGELYQKMKNRPNPTSEDNKFALLGDPSMRLLFPEHHIALDSVNGQSAGGFADTLKAFSVVTIKGHIQKRSGEPFADFNGNLWVKFFDKPQTRYTLDNDKNNIKIPFSDQSSYIYKGEVSVENGQFTIVFSIPKDIAYNVAQGKLFLDAHNGKVDASGAAKLLVGSSLDNIAPDNEGPRVRLFMNDTLFKSGGIVEPNALFLAKVYDESGINATGSGIGRDMVAILDEGSSAEQTFVLNDYFSYELNSYTRGMASYPLANLSEGKHTITFKVWDIHNNSATASIEFVVVAKESFLVTDYYAYPNPFRDQVNFAFTHNLAGKKISAHIEIVDVSGRKIREFDQTVEDANTTETRLEWDGKNANGAMAINGIYIYRVRLIAEDSRSAVFSGKIIKN
ncbi:MAG: type IX secretion system sortase PorU [Bacteroidia bacterium]|nr:type IX secretion system sortase PorU [Bacteroidia bacterium]